MIRVRRRLAAFAERFERQLTRASGLPGLRAIPQAHWIGGAAAIDLALAFEFGKPSRKRIVFRREFRHIIAQPSNCAAIGLAR